MEDALAQRVVKLRKNSNWMVLILVLMEDALALAEELYKLMQKGVLILVLMEDALAPKK